MIKQNDKIIYEVFVTDQVSLCRRLFTSPRFYIVFLVVQVAIISLVISMWDSDSYSTDQMVVITNKQMQEVLFNGTEEHCKFLFVLETQFTHIYSQKYPPNPPSNPPKMINLIDIKLIKLFKKCSMLTNFMYMQQSCTFTNHVFDIAISS